MAESKRLICKSSELTDSGKAVRFEIQDGQEAVACFAIRFGGEVRAYINRCPHMGTQLDWNPGEIFEESGLYLICATHGAMFDPVNGLCVAGPCHGQSLQDLPVRESNGLILLQSRVNDTGSKG